jgi:ArsR family transcriptional regulator
MTEIFKALSDENRLRILFLLSKRDLCVCELEACLMMKQSNLSRHLAALSRAGLVDRYKVAQWAHYRIHPSFIEGHALVWNYVLSKISAHEMHLMDEERYERYALEAERCGMSQRCPPRLDVIQHIR